MENKIIFREMLSEVKRAADAAGNVISKEEIREILNTMPLEEEHFQLIYSYLAEQNITVVDTKEEVQEQPLEEDRRSLSIYLEELSELSEDIFEDESEILELAAKGDAAARNRLIEEYLPRICEMASEYECEEIPAEDLIQEGNLGLLMALETLREAELGAEEAALDQGEQTRYTPAACRAHILNSIGKAMEAALKDSRDERTKGEGIASRVNHLNEAVQNLERDLEHKVSAEELSAYLEMPLEEIKDILRMSGDQIEIEGNSK